MYLYCTFGEFAYRVCFTQFYACSIFCERAPKLAVRAQTDTEFVCVHICVCSSRNTPKGKFLKFKDPIQVKLKLQVTRS